MYKGHIMEICEIVEKTLSYTVRVRGRLPRVPKCDVFVEEIHKNAMAPWVLNVDGIAIVDEVEFSWNTEYDLESHIWQPVRYMRRNNVFLTIVAED